MARWIAAAILFAVTLAHSPPAHAYSVLAHEAVIDATWDTALKPLLQRRFGATAAQLREARAYAYGGCLIQDLGYYPFSSRFFGNLTHYIRSGDFVEALLREATTANELAFALGALAHYAADTRGHALAVNLAVPMVYPELRRKFGNEVTYAEHSSSHLKTEFGFDVLQVARGRYAPDAYHDFIGFEVAKDLLARAVRATYGLELTDIFGNIGVSIATFRWTISTMVPEMTKIAWESRREEIEALHPGGTRERFIFASSRADFEKRWGTEYKRPGFVHRLLSWILRVIPRVGPFRPLAYRSPTPEAERLFVESFKATVDRYRSLVQTAAVVPSVDNLNLDTGEHIVSGDYELADKTYAELLSRLAADRFRTVDPPLRKTLTAFYTKAERPRGMSARRWRKVTRLLAELKATPDEPSAATRR